MAGQAASFVITVAISNGAYTLAGQDSAFSQGVIMAADHGSFSLSGQAASFAHAAVAANGTYSLAGQDAALSQGVIMAADQGSFSLAGQDAGFTTGVAIAANHGTFSLSGQAALFARSLVAAAGSLSLAGQSATFVNSADFSWSWDLEAYISGAWVSITEDVMCHDHPVTAVRGIDGSDVKSRVAAPGSISCALDNGKSNSAGLIGYYSLDHANMRSGFAEDTPLRLKITSGATTKYVWRGYLVDLRPTPGQFGELKSFLDGTDYMMRMTEHKLEGIQVQENKRSDQVMQTLLDNMPTAPVNTSLETDSFTMRLALHSERDESTTAMGATAKLCQTAMAYAFIRGNTTDGETFVFQRELSRMTNSVIATFSDTMSGLQITRSTDRIKNRVIGTIQPATIDTDATTLLASLANEFQLDPGESETITLRMRDPSGAATRISGKDLVTTLVADTHFKFSSTSGGGNDMNASLGTVVTYSGNTVKIVVTNNGSVRGYINLLEIFGKGIYIYDPIDIVVESGSADKDLTYELYYLDDYYRGKDYITAVHLRTATEYTDVDSITYYADLNSTLMGYALNVDIGHRIALVETATGLNAEFTVNKITYSIQTNGLLRIDYGVEFAGVYNFFTLDDSVLGVLDDADNVLSPF